MMFETVGIIRKIGRDTIRPFRSPDHVRRQRLGGIRMRVLVYKRTHNDDPDASGCFGAYDCMGMIRDRRFDAVIGVGGIGSEARADGIAGQVNWVGIGPHKAYVQGKRGPEVTFDHYIHYGTDGPDFSILAPLLAERMYANNVRSVLEGLSGAEKAEAIAILRLAEGEPPSPGRQAIVRSARATRRCRSSVPTSRCNLSRPRRDAEPRG
jgi:hypothetical protein